MVVESELAVTDVVEGVVAVFEAALSIVVGNDDAFTMTGLVCAFATTVSCSAGVCMLETAMV